MTRERDPDSTVRRAAAVLPALLLAASLCGCSTVPDAALVDPAKYNLYRCGDLERAMQRLRTRMGELQALKAKAHRGPSGDLIGALAYDPEIKSVRGNMALIAEVSRRKDCEPPVVAAAPR
jgi:hypothetical protein